MDQERARTVGVYGATPMGRVTARFFAECNFHVYWVDADQRALDRELQEINDVIGQRIADGHMTEKQAAKITSYLHATVDKNSLKLACCVIEALEENLETKQAVLKGLEKFLDPATLLVTSTYELGITRVANGMQRPENLLGLHLMGIGGTFQVAELIAGERTSPAAMSQFRNLIGATFVVPVEVSDRPGYLLNRMLLAQINEAAHLVEEGASSIEEIDLACQSFMQQIIGPLAIADLMGIDVVVAQMEALYLASGNPRYQPCPLLKEFVKAGRLGRNSGRGFYQYG